MYPAPEELRQDFSELRRQQSGGPTPSPMHALGKVDVNGEIALKRQLSIIGLVVFCTCLVLVALNAYSRDSDKHTEVVGSAQSFGPGASVAAETTFPTVTPTAYGGVDTRPTAMVESQYGGNNFTFQNQGYRSNYQSPGYVATPTSVHGVNLPVNDGNGVRLRRFVTR
ncbi:MAG: hypothetical protein K2Z81_09345 [Cyanobacteria bacterium]|nr:hypothetical protein [Cyanobacteriota bacterium]